MNSLLGDNLIFIISQPRAGSTLLQRILGNHSDIYTVSEPWLMLYPLYALRPEGYLSEYNEQWARVAVRGFLSVLPGGIDDYVEGLRRMYSHLYQQALARSGKRYFLDKTPRYYFIINELYHTFPNAHYIILLRNPLAVLCSVLKTWVKEDWFRLCRFRHDLIRAPRLLLEAVGFLGKRGVVVHYEDLITDPEGEVRRICEILQIRFTEEMIEYGHHDLPRWECGDEEGVYQHTRPACYNGEKWIQALEDPQVWRIANDYLQLLGAETLREMGYLYEELRKVLEAQRFPRNSLWLTFPLGWLLKKPDKERKKYERHFLRLMRSLQQRGIHETTVVG